MMDKEIKEAIERLKIVRKDLEQAWRGRAGLEQELIDFDLIINLAQIYLNIAEMHKVIEERL